MNKKKMKSSLITRLLIAGIILMACLPLAGQIRFEDVTRKAGLIEPLKGIMSHCAAWGDVNGDGREDLYICGAKGQPGGLMIQQKNGTFEFFWTGVTVT